MLLSVLTAVGSWLLYQRKPSNLARIAVVGVILVVSVLTAWMSCMVVARNHIGTDVTQVVFAPASWPLMMEGFHDTLFHKAIISLFVGRPPLGFPVLSSGYVDDQSTYVPFLTAVGGILTGALNVAASFLVIVVLRKMNRVSPFVRPRREPGSDNGGVPLPRSLKRIGKADRRLQRYRTVLLAASLAFLIVGAACVLAPVRVPAGSASEEFEFPPLVPNYIEVFMPFTMSQTAKVIVASNATESDRLSVWLGYEAGFDIPFLHWSGGGTLTQWENRSYVEFIFGLENVSMFAYLDTDPVRNVRRTLFLRAITIHVSYSGINPAQCRVSIQVFQNPFVIPGLVIVGAAAVPLWCFVGLIWRQYQTVRRKLVEMAIGSADDAVD
jgi:hypothetical protein